MVGTLATRSRRTKARSTGSQLIALSVKEAKLMPRKLTLTSWPRTQEYHDLQRKRANRWKLTTLPRLWLRSQQAAARRQHPPVLHQPQLVFPLHGAWVAYLPTFHIPKLTATLRLN